MELDGFKKNYLDVVFDEVNLSLQQNIKRVFDPNGIMNPGKIFI